MRVQAVGTRNPSEERGQGMTTSHETGVRAQEAAKTGVDQGRQMASVAQEEARNVATEARTQARGLLHQATGEVHDQTRQQTRRLADTIRTVGEDLNHMADRGESGMATELVRQVAGRARSLSWQLESRDPADLLEDLKGFARRKPGTFLLGALAAGVVAGRLARSAKEAQSGGSGDTVTTESLGSTAPTGTPGPVPGTGVTEDPSLRASSGAVPSGVGDVPGTATGTPLAGTPGPAGTTGTPAATGTTGPQTFVDRPTPNDPSGRPGDPTEPGGRA
jgi:hypothetical protein